MVQNVLRMRAAESTCKQLSVKINFVLTRFATQLNLANVGVSNLAVSKNSDFHLVLTVKLSEAELLMKDIVVEGMSVTAAHSKRRQ